jgi:hypothetical protein
MVPLHIHIVVYTLRNKTEEFTPLIFEFKGNINRIRKYFMFVLRFEPRSLE